MEQSSVFSKVRRNFISRSPSYLESPAGASFGTRGLKLTVGGGDAFRNDSGSVWAQAEKTLDATGTKFTGPNIPKGNASLGIQLETSRLIGNAAGSTSSMSSRHELSPS